MGSSVLLAILQVAAGGSLVQILIRFGAFLYKRLSGPSNPENRKTSASADSTSVETADAVLVMVRGELQRLNTQRDLEHQEWDAERVKSAASMDNASREIARANSELARVKSDLSVALSQLAQRDGPGPGRHSSNPPSTYDDWRKGP